MEIRMEGVWKSFGDKTVLRDVSMAFPQGSVTCLMGPSGCGKTTLLRIVMGLVKPDRGRVSGVPEGISVLFQEDRLCQGFSPVANVRLVTAGACRRRRSGSCWAAWAWRTAWTCLPGSCREE